MSVIFLNVPDDRIRQSINGPEYQKQSLLTIQTVLLPIELTGIESYIECTFLLRFLLLIADNRIESNSYSNGIDVSAVRFQFT